MRVPSKSDCLVAIQVLDYFAEHVAIPAEGGNVVRVVNSLMRSTCKNASRVVSMLMPNMRDEIVN